MYDRENTLRRDRYRLMDSIRNAECISRRDAAIIGYLIGCSLDEDLEFACVQAETCRVIEEEGIEFDPPGYRRSRLDNLRHDIHQALNGG